MFKKVFIILIAFNHFTAVNAAENDNESIRSAAVGVLLTNVVAEGTLASKQDHYERILESRKRGRTTYLSTTDRLNNLNRNIGDRVQYTVNNFEFTRGDRLLIEYFPDRNSTSKQIQSQSTVIDGHSYQLNSETRSVLRVEDEIRELKISQMRLERRLSNKSITQSEVDNVVKQLNLVRVMIESQQLKLMQLKSSTAIPTLGSRTVPGEVLKVIDSVEKNGGRITRVEVIPQALDSKMNKVAAFRVANVLSAIGAVGALYTTSDLDQNKSSIEE